MSDPLADALGVDLTDPVTVKALGLVDANRNLRLELRSARIANGVYAAEMAKQMGHADASAFEEWEATADPTLHQLGVYCLAAGLRINFEVVADKVTPLRPPARTSADPLEIGQTFYEVARPGHVVEILEFGTSVDPYSRRQEMTVKYKHLTAHNKRAQSMPTSTPTRKFRQRYSPTE